MKNLIVILFLLNCSCVGLSVKVDDIHLDKPEFWLGMVSAPIVHEISHSVYMESRNVDYSFSGGKFYYSCSELSECRNIDRSGFIGQLVVGELLSSSKLNKDFVSGFRVGNILQIGSYGIRNGSDLDNINDFEYLGYVGLSLIDFKF